MVVAPGPKVRRMNAITVLENDHKKVEGLFAKFEKLTPRALKTMRDLNEQIIHELAVHAAIEEQVFYPAVRASVPEADFNVLESLEEHHIVKWTLSELDGMDPSHERFRAKMTVLIESVRHHVEEEEGELFPKVRRALSADVLAEIGDAMESARELAPTRPHPKAPDEPPGNLANVGAAILDKARDAGRSAVREAGKKAKSVAGEAKSAGKSAAKSKPKSKKSSSAKKKSAKKKSGGRKKSRSS